MQQVKLTLFYTGRFWTFFSIFSRFNVKNFPLHLRFKFRESELSTNHKTTSNHLLVTSSHHILWNFQRSHWADTSLLPNVISIGSSVFAPHSCAQHTDTLYTHNATSVLAMRPKCNKWSKNFDERMHRLLRAAPVDKSAAPCCCERLLLTQSNASEWG